MALMTLDGGRIGVATYMLIPILTKMGELKKSEILQFIINNGMIGISDVRNGMKAMEDDRKLPKEETGAKLQQTRHVQTFPP